MNSNFKFNYIDELVSYSIADEEYELQFFQFSVNDFLNHFKHLVSSSIVNVFDEYINLVKITVKFDNYSILEKFRDEVIISCEKELKKELKSVAGIIRHYLSIPKNVLIPPKKAINRQYSLEEVEKLENEVKCLEKECKEEQLMIHLCETELEILKNVKSCNSVYDCCFRKISMIDNAVYNELLKISLASDEHPNDIVVEEN